MVNLRTKWAIFNSYVNLPEAIYLSSGSLGYRFWYFMFVDHLDFVLVEIDGEVPFLRPCFIPSPIPVGNGTRFKDHHVPFDTPGTTQDMFLFFHRFGEAWTLGMLAALALFYCLRLLRDFKERLYIILTICSTDIRWNQMKSLTNLFWSHVIRRELGWIWFHVIHIHLVVFLHSDVKSLTQTKCNGKQLFSNPLVSKCS